MIDKVRSQLTYTALWFVDESEFFALLTSNGAIS